ncbi:hypothetical protein [Spirulina major]|uniref:hypothetical protein n=1 Tax=Spirulina major TaxID=270636 RepID=UPI000933ECC5|nr:hypothetical protein [Spirulina major]
MSEELVQWLAEIRTLKQALAEAERDRDAAQASATHWRKLYNTEARQRREEAKIAQAQQDALQAQLRGGQSTPETTAQNPTNFAAELAPIRNEEQLRQKLVAVLQERDRALDALRHEQENHRYTRQNLTAVIGDTMEQLTLLRGGTLPPPSPRQDEPESVAASASIAPVDVMSPEVVALLEAPKPPATPPPQTSK